MPKASENIGLWLVGACGGVATTTVLGIEAVRHCLADPTGLIGHLPPFAGLQLAPLDRWVVGGHEIRQTSVEESAGEMHRRAGVFSADMLTSCRRWLRQCDREIRDGCMVGCGPVVARMADRPGAIRDEYPAAIVERLTEDLTSFRERNKLRHLVVVNVASTEPPFVPGDVHERWGRLSRALGKKDTAPLPASSLYALAAVEARASYINFTPSAGIDVPAIREHADDSGIAYMGADAKTGETLMKSVLAPMFAARNLRILSWIGHNIFGNRDGVVLDDPANKAAKVKSKDHLIPEIVGYRPKTLVSIEYVESLDDWKTAWDHIHYEGFLGTKMVLQFIWQGCDSLLAAPLVIELARFAERAARDGECGPLKHLACFFKSPMNVEQQAFAAQYEMLIEYARAKTPQEST